MRAFLVLYLVDRVHGLGWSDGRALSFYGWYTGLCYLSTVAGGWVADRFLGQRRAVVIGGTLMMAGQFLCALKQEPLLYAGAALLIVGNGLFKANISTMVGQLYRPGDARRDAAFTIFYMGINLGAAVGPLICGTPGREGGLVARVRQRRAGHGAGRGILPPAPRTAAPGRGGGRAAGTPADGGHARRRPLSREERDRVLVIFVITVFVSFFWAGLRAGRRADEPVHRPIRWIGSCWGTRSPPPGSRR